MKDVKFTVSLAGHTRSEQLRGACEEDDPGSEVIWISQGSLQKPWAYSRKGWEEGGGGGEENLSHWGAEEGERGISVQYPSREEGVI
jgi:hypothetical protein